MAHSGILSTVNLYTMREADLTNRLGDIMMDITQTAKESAQLSEDTSASKQAVMAEYDSDDDEYEEAMDAIQDEYQCNLAQISAWESELDLEKESIESELQATSATKESYTTALKQNISRDCKYADSGSSTS